MVWATAAAWIFGLVTTVVAITRMGSPPGFQNRSLQLVLDSANGAVAILAAFLLYGRYRRSHRAEDYFLSQGLLLLALGGIGLTVVLNVLGAGQPGTVDLWLPQVVRIAGAGCFIIAALAGRRSATLRPGGTAQPLPWLVVAAALAVLWLSRNHLPVAVRASRDGLDIASHPLLIAGLAIGAAAFLAASVLFTAQARSNPDDELLRWLGAATALLGFSRVHYLVFPSLYATWISAGDFLRSAAYLLLMLAAAREIGRYWEAQAELAVLEDRRRVARELHDGVVQELAYIRLEARGLTVDRRVPTAHHSGSIRMGPGGTSDPGDPGRPDRTDDAGQAGERILSSCDRALDEARAAIDALGQAPDQPLGDLLQRAARQVAGRYAGRVVVDIDDSVLATPEQRHALARITREATSNAMRHGGAERVELQLARDGQRRRLVLRDDGHGFDLDEARATGTGYGLTTMHERALALPGTFEVRSSEGRGTTVEVTW